MTVIPGVDLSGFYGITEQMIQSADLWNRDDVTALRRFDVVI